MLHNYASTASKEGDFADSEQASSGTAHSAENPDKDYQLLGVQPNCSAEELKAAYRNAVSQWHPDHLQQMAPELRQFATERLAKINAAYSRLSKSQAVGACDSE
jgi:DnaJ-class molecular chaperone